MPKPAAPLTARATCAKIVKLLEALPPDQRTPTLRAAEAMLSLDASKPDQDTSA